LRRELDGNNDWDDPFLIVRNAGRSQSRLLRAESLASFD